jgi:glutathione S-transferase
MLGFRHDIVYINLKNKPDWYLEKLPSGKVPAIIVDGEFIYESLIISDFLDEKFPERPLYPKDPIKKVKDRLLVDAFGKVNSFNALLRCENQGFIRLSIKNKKIN